MNVFSLTNPLIGELLLKSILPIPLWAFLLDYKCRFHSSVKEIRMTLTKHHFFTICFLLSKFIHSNQYLTLNSFIWAFLTINRNSISIKLLPQYSHKSQITQLSALIFPNIERINSFHWPEPEKGILYFCAILWWKHSWHYLKLCSWLLIEENSSVTPQSNMIWFSRSFSLSSLPLYQ